MVDDMISPLFLLPTSSYLPFWDPPSIHLECYKLSFLVRSCHNVEPNRPESIFTNLGFCADRFLADRTATLHIVSKLYTSCSKSE